MKHSNIQLVTLRKVSLNTSGTYRCEVTARNSPGFDAKFQNGKMVVLGKTFVSRGEINAGDLQTDKNRGDSAKARTSWKYPRPETAEGVIVIMVCSCSISCGLCIVTRN